MLETKRVLLRKIEQEDSGEVFRYRSDSKSNKYQGFIPSSIREVNDFISRTPNEINTPESWFQLVITEKRKELIIGDIGLHFFGKENKQVEFGCTLDKDFQNQGYANEAINCVIKYLFEELEKHRIIASIDPRNVSSISLAKRIGMRKEAHFIKSLYINGEWVDDVIYSLLREDWNNGYCR